MFWTTGKIHFNGCATDSSKTASMFARELAITCPLGTLRDSLTLQQQGAAGASDGQFCARMMPENRDNGHAKADAWSRLRGVDRHRDGPWELTR
jgi:hypothetical protein